MNPAGHRANGRTPAGFPGVPTWGMIGGMRTMPLSLLSGRLLAGLLLLAVAVRADDENSVLTAVFAKTDQQYRRFKGPDGKWERQYYAMVNGGAFADTIRDNAQERIPFSALAAVLAEHLARQRYLPATKPDNVDFLLVVNWGRTMPFIDNVYREGVDNVMDAMNTHALKSLAADAARANVVNQTEASINLTGSVEDMEAQAAESQMENAMIMQDMMNRSRNLANARTARLLGYMDDINQADGPQRFAGGGNLYDDLIADIEEPRYYITLSAYDFQKTVREGKPKLRWVARMSMRAPGNSFAEKAAAMIAYSASRFGRNTNGLERKLYPQYKVNLEDVRFLGLAGGNSPAEEPAAGDPKK